MDPIITAALIECSTALIVVGMLFHIVKWVFKNMPK